MWLLKGTLLFGLIGLIVAKCPSDCSQHGICTIVGETSYCDCDSGYGNDDCSHKFCPKGDDPLTEGQVSRTIRVRWTCIGGDLSTSTIQFSLGRSKISGSADAKALGDAQCSSWFSSLSLVDKATCTQEFVDSQSGGSFIVSFDKFAMVSVENNLFNHDGNPELSKFDCKLITDDDDINSPQCYIEDIVNINIKEHVECSNRGRCNPKFGSCICEAGFHGPSCDDMTDDDDTLIALSDGPYFTGNTLRLHASRSSSSAFNLLSASVGTRSILTLSGDGHMHLNGNAVVQDGLSVGDGDVRIDNGRLKIFKTVDDDDDDDAIVTIQSNSTRDSLTLLDIRHNSDSIISVSSDGNIVSEFGNLFLTNGILKSNSIQATDELLVNGKSSFSDGVIVFDASGHVTMMSNTDNNDDDAMMKMMCAKSSSSCPDGLIINLSPSNPDSVSTVFSAQGSNGVIMEIASNSNIFMNSNVQVSSGGLSVTSGGVDVSAGGLSVDGGIVLRSGALVLEDDGLILKKMLMVDLSDDDGPAVHVKMGGDDGDNVMIVLEADGHVQLLQGLVGDAVTIEVDSNGNVMCNDIEATGNVMVSEDLVARSNFIIEPSSSSANDGDSSYVIIDGDTDLFAIMNGNNVPGKVLFVTNKSDRKLIHDDICIESSSSAILIHDENKWNVINANGNKITNLEGIESFSASNHLNIGNFSFSAGSLFSSSSSSGTICMFGTGGRIASAPSMKIDPSSQALYVEKMMIRELVGSMDGRGNVVKSIVLDDVAVKSASVVVTKELYLSDINDGVDDKKVMITKQMMMMVDAKTGKVTASPIHLTDNNKLIVSTISGHSIDGDVIMSKGNFIFNGSLIGGDANMKQAKFESVAISDLSIDVGSLMSIGRDGKLMASPFHSIGNLLHVNEISGFACQGNIDLQNHMMTRVNINSSNEIRVSNLFANNVMLSSSNNDDKKASLVMMDKHGKLSRFDNSVINDNSELIMENLNLENLFVNGGFMQKIKLKDVEFVVDEPEINSTSSSALNFGNKVYSGHLNGFKLIHSKEVDKFAGGVIVTDSNGYPRPSNVVVYDFKLDSLKINSPVSSDLNLAGNLNLKGVTSILTAKSINSSSIAADEIILRKSCASNCLVMSSSSSSHLSLLSPDVLTISDSNTAVINSLKVNYLAGDIDGNNHLLSNIIINSTSISNSKDLVTRSLLVEGPAKFGADGLFNGSLHVRGSVIGSGPYVDSSDLRLKKNIKRLDSSELLEAVTRLVPVSFDMIQDVRQQHSQIGFVAQDVMKLLPQIVYTGDDDENKYLGIAYSRMVVALTGAVQELSAKLDLMEKKIQNCQQKIN